MSSISSFQVQRTKLDPVTVELVRGCLRSVQREMEAIIERTAMSPFIREKKDYFAAIYDAEGRLVAGTPMPSGNDMLPEIYRK